jgi:hypothetical protein
LSLEGDLIHPLRGQGAGFTAGGEFDFQKQAFLRAGYRGRFRGRGRESGDGFTAGVGGRWGDWQADYAVSPFDDLGAAHRFSLTWRWREARKDPFRFARWAGNDAFKDR